MQQCAAGSWDVLDLDGLWSTAQQNFIGLIFGSSKKIFFKPLAQKWIHGYGLSWISRHRQV